MADGNKTGALKTEFVSPETCVFSVSDTGFLRVTLGGRVYPRVVLTRALPFSEPEKYIGISDVDRKEIGMIEDASAFSDEQRRLIENELSLRYYCPEVEEIRSIREKMGHFYFEVLIGGQEKRFTVRDISKSVRTLGQGVEITDMDANRYRIPDLSAIGRKSRRMLEPYIY